MLNKIREIIGGNAATPAGKATLEETKAALDAVASKHGFRCVPVSWEDAQRGTVGGALSCWGGNISDVRLWAKDGTLLYTLRTDNWNERLGYVASKDVAVVTGNHVPGGEPYAPITLQKYLKNFKQYAGYAGVKSEQLWDETADQLLSIRFQAVFLPIKDEETSEFCTEVYNYNAHDDSNPRNNILLCTAQGTHVQQDGSGAKKVFIHNVDTHSKVHRYWLEAERSKHKVGGAQLETEEEAAAAAARGKATAIHVGTKAMGTRFNVQMLIQLPLKQKAAAPTRMTDLAFACGGAVPVSYCSSAMAIPCAPSVQMCSALPSCPPPPCPPPPPPCSAPPCSAPPCEAVDYDEECADEDECADGALLCEAEEEAKICCEEDDKFCEKEEMPSKKKKICRDRKEPPKRKVAVGTANAARVSRGSEYDTWKGVSNTEPVRDPSQHGTITVTLYYTVAGGVPSEADVESCVADLDALYKACPTDKKLVDCSEITAELTVKNMMDINKKVAEQPYQPPAQPYVKSSFPTDDE